MRILLLVILIGIITGVVSAQTETPTPVLSIPVSEFVFITMVPYEGTPEGQMTRIDYVVTAGDALIGLLVLFIVISLWGFFFVYVFLRHRRPES